MTRGAGRISSAATAASAATTAPKITHCNPISLSLFADDIILGSCDKLSKCLPTETAECDLVLIISSDMTNADLTAKSSHPSDSWPANVADPTQVTSRIYRGRQCSYSRPDTGKVDIPHLQTHVSLQGQQAWREGTTVW
ncbi:hypothetical protein B296_00043840 [Ensete ventricosum]|uniref:Uncharacterized protein n=1 Tax=Ensete ventricosum TaxID=4639 RepID=A0A426YDD2_ENSVE|nr:hypothetical protein B296_00043840 [Ensete ventricosum]